MSTLTAEINKSLKEQTNNPLWKGPEVDGVTFSLLSRFLVCRERFRLYVIEGLRPMDTFNHRIEYGNMWHICEENFPAAPWPAPLREYCQKLCNRYPLQQEQIDKWYNVCKMQFPIYVDYWSENEDEQRHTPLLQEKVFDVPYGLLGGRTVRLRGKWDSIDLIGKGKSASVYLQENKTKGDINEEQLKRQLSFDLQTMLYLVALLENPSVSLGPEMQGKMQMIIKSKREWQQIVKGVRYNVVRRPLSGGRHSIRPHEGKVYKTKPSKAPESSEKFYKRLGGLIAGEPEYFFVRRKVEVTSEDIERFRRECLDPVLEQLCDWWEWVSDTSGHDFPRTPDDPFRLPASEGLHYRYPFGIFNPMNEGGASEMDEFLATGSRVGLQQVDTLFGELE